MGELAVSCKCARVPGLRARIVIAEATVRHRRNHPAAVVAHALIFLTIHIIRHGAVRVELTGRLPVEGLLLMTMGSWRARGSRVVVHVVVKVLIIHDMLKLLAPKSRAEVLRRGDGALSTAGTRSVPVNVARRKAATGDKCVALPTKLGTDDDGLLSLQEQSEANVYSLYSF